MKDEDKKKKMFYINKGKLKFLENIKKFIVLEEVVL